jgi:hypothetical protein
MGQRVPDWAVVRLTGCLKDRAVNVIQPAVIATADAMLGDNAILQGGSAVAALPVQQPDMA